MTIKQLALVWLAALSTVAAAGCGAKCEPECGPGFTCDTEVDPPRCQDSSRCDPACGAGQFCDTSVTPAACRSSANDCSPACADGQSCDSTKTPAVCVESVPCDPGCGEGLACDSSATPQRCECLNAFGGIGCPAGQRCDTSGVPASCKEICNDPYGCAPRVESCNETTGKCETVSCGAARCEPGQGCFNPRTGATGAGALCTCLPEGIPSVDAADTCRVYGMVCDFDENAPAASRCKVPGLWEACDKAAAPPCEGTLDCADYTGEGEHFFCMVRCAGNGDCGSDTGSYCAPAGQYGAGHCDDNLCSIPESWGGQHLSEDEWRSLFFGKCSTFTKGEDVNAPATLKGTCVPYARVHEGQRITYGVCEEFGLVAPGGECDPEAGRESLDQVCGFNESCHGIQPADREHLGGVCVPNCNAAPSPIPADDCGGYCSDVSGLPVGVEGLGEKTRWGLCLIGCDPYGAAPCPDDLLGNHQGCRFDAKLDGEGYCQALLPEAKGLGEACTDSEVEHETRSPCGDRSVCLIEAGETVGECRGFCSLSACAEGDSGSCSGCAGTSCCVPSCAQKCNGEPDGCGGACGCPVGRICDPATNVCEACEPSCKGRCDGGPDGCGGTCGCPAGSSCNPATNNCVACSERRCVGKACGDDGCGGSCGTCGPGTACSPAGACESCVPSCRFKSCGDDGCGGRCGAGCVAGEVCRSFEQACGELFEVSSPENLGFCGPAD